MQRRKFVIGMGALATGTAAAVGTGAFNNVEAERSVEVDVVSDEDAYLGLSAEREDIISDDGDDGTLTLDLGSQETAQGGQGFNDDAITEINGIFSITNQGTETVDVSFEDGVAGVDFSVQDEELEAGEYTLVDVTVDTLNESPDEEDGGSVRVVAEA